MNPFRTTSFYPGLLLLILFLSACKKDEIETIPTPIVIDSYSNRVAVAWNTLYLGVERFTPGYRPPVSARTSAYLGLTAYETLLPSMSEDYNSMQLVYEDLILPSPEENQEYNWEVALNAAYEAAFNFYFPTAPATQQFEVIALADSLENVLLPSVSQAVFNRSVDFGREVASTIFEWSFEDTWGHEGFLKNTDDAYIPPEDKGLWQPTYPDFSPALLPHWGKVRTFAATDADTGPAPLPYSEEQTSPLYQQAIDVQYMVRDIKGGSRNEDRWIAEFWSDDCPILTFSPAARMISITNQVIEKEQLSLDEAVYTYAKVGFAICDAGIRCWYEKYKYNCERPIDYIRRNMHDSNWNTIMCPDGSGGYFTPNFPAYPSGHAAFAGAAAEVLTEIFGDSYRFIDRSHEGRTEFQGRPRPFNSFYGMAKENAYSRIPLGVHFRMDSDAGLDVGFKVGRRVNALPWKK